LSPSINYLIGIPKTTDVDPDLAALVRG